jgi:spermidine synthase
LAVLLSSALLFLLQPMCAKMLLPRLGGTPAGWNTCMVFFQAGLLLGYVYAHRLPGLIGLRPHALLHIALLATAFLFLPIGFPADGMSPEFPVASVLLLLAINVGMPFVLLASSAPLIQRWVATTGRDPYGLYAMSNLGSFVGLLAYPFVLEPTLTLSQQSELWRWGFLAAIVLQACCLPWREAMISTTRETASVPTNRQRLGWVLLALVPSSLLLSVTTHLTTDLAPIPLLWVLPLGLYLATFIVAFSPRGLASVDFLGKWTPLWVLVIALTMWLEANQPLVIVLGIHLAGFFWIALLCHAKLAQSRPAANQLTDFYLCLALGGVLGGAFNVLLAPLLFNGLAEYPMMLLAACLLGGSTTWRLPKRADVVYAFGVACVAAALLVAVQTLDLFSLPAGPLQVAAVFVLPALACYVCRENAWRFTLGMAGLFAVGMFHHGIQGRLLHQERSAFGVHRVSAQGGFRRLIHGHTVHGMQDEREETPTPLTYYHPKGPIGQLLVAMKDDPRLAKVGVVGLGAGALAAYARPADDWTFYEIDPAVKRIAENRRYFSFLATSRGRVRVELGDARLQLQNTRDRFGVLIVDAFGSDAIPTHLLTREALELYCDRIQERGLLAFHISNEYLDLEPVLANLAAALSPSLVAYVCEDRAVSDEERRQGKYPSIWLVMARSETDLGACLAKMPWRRALPRPGVRIWSDDYTNLFQAFRVQSRSD